MEVKKNMWCSGGGFSRSEDVVFELLVGGRRPEGWDQSLDARRFLRMDHVLNSQAEPCGGGAPSADLCLPLPGGEGRGSGMKFSSVAEIYGSSTFIPERVTVKNSYSLYQEVHRECSTDSRKCYDPTDRDPF